jgi:hypothetical protein
VWESYECATAFQVVEQPVAGLSNAREKGIEQAQYEYLLFSVMMITGSVKTMYRLLIR